MAVRYLSVAYTEPQEIPPKGNHPLEFPRDEQTDPWEMHQKDGAIINPAADGIAWIQLDVTWEGEEYPRRYSIVGDGLPYENNTTALSTPWTSITPVRYGEPIAVLVGHDQPTPQRILSARLTVVIQDDVATPEEPRLRVRAGTDPWVPEDAEPPGQPGGTTPPETDDDTIPR